MTDCTRFQDDLKAYADGELPWLRRAAVRRHLTHCASCQEEITFMTQISEDLRAAETGEPLPPSLREKLIAEPTQAQVPTLPKREGEELGAEQYSQTLRPPVSGGPLRSKEVGSRNRRLPAWTFAAVALVAWFLLFPMFQKTRSIQGRSTPMVAEAPLWQHERDVRVFKTLPPDNATGNFSPAEPAPPPKAAYAPSAVPDVPAPPVAAGAVSQSRVVYGTFGIESLDRNGNINTLNGDPDSLRQVHKEASIGIQVPNPEATGDKLNQMVQETGGYVAANNLSTDTNGLKSGELIVKVPEPQFETFLASVAKLGVVVSKNVTGQDITEKTSDAHEAQGVEESDLTQAEARLKALGSHAKWDDTQNAEDLRVQLAQTRARLKLLKRMAALGTITIDLNQTPKAAAAPPVTNGFTGSLKATTHDALQSLVGSAGALLALVIWLLAYAPSGSRCCCSGGTP